MTSTEAGRTLTAPSSATAQEVLASYLGRDAKELEVASLGVGTDGLTHLKVTQKLGGLRVFGADSKATLTTKGELVHVIDALAPGAVVASPRLPAFEVLRRALAHHGYATPALAEREVKGFTTTFEPTAELFEAPTVERVAFVDAKGQLSGGFLVETWSLEKNVLHHTLLDENGDVVSVELRTNNDAYRVFVEDPLKGGQVVVNGPGAGNAESPSGWLNAGTQLSINVAGNNVNAYLDADGNNRADRGGASIGNGQFLAVADLAAAPTTTANREVGVQNLFYLNNRIHDVLYRHGFTEAAGNFQTNNFGKGGAGNDPVQAEAQDGSGTDNANFSTPADGQKPRMQMYLWTGHGPSHEVLSSLGVFAAMGSDFGAALTTTGLSGATALANDGAGVASDGCEAMTGLTGKIAVVDRGTCNFTVKVLNAQNAGAVAVIVVNNTGTTEYFGMTGTDRKVKIPSVMVSFNDGAALKANLGLSTTTRKKATQPLQIDGDVDSDIVFHEYGHGLSWRMIGGMSGKLAGAIGEGASDVVAFLVNGDDRVGEYAWGSAGGIRRYPYAGYPLTYSAVTGAEVHDDGEIYAAAMWRLHELFLAAGYTDEQLLDLFVDGMNYTPATPAFEDMRDGMLQASNNRGGAWNCLIWKAFAQYGVGVGADGVATTAGVTITQSFTVPATCP